MQSGPHYFTVSILFKKGSLFGYELSFNLALGLENTFSRPPLDFHGPRGATLEGILELP